MKLNAYNVYYFRQCLAVTVIKKISPNKLWLVAAIAVAIMAGLFYAPSLGWGFINDDPTGHLRWMAGRTVLSFFVDASGHGYYRPISFALWQIFHALLGKHDPFALHLLNVAAHAGNAALVCWLGCQLATRPTLFTTVHLCPRYRCKRGQAPNDQPSSLLFTCAHTTDASEGRRPIPNAQYLLYGCVAGLFFALYPFSYEAVPYVGSLVHPLVTLFVLLSLASYLKWRESGKWHYFAATHAALVLAVFTQENGIIAPFLILALGVSDSRFKISSFKSRITFYASNLTFLAAPLIFAVAWLLVPKSEGLRTIAPQAVIANILPFVQALVYPLAPLARQNLAWLALIAAASLAGLYLLARALGQARLLAFSLLWWALASLPSILLLDHAYVSGSPRLFYLGSVGAALLWAMPIQIANHKFRITNDKFKIANYVSRFATCIVPLAFCFWILTSSLPYTACQLCYQGYASEIGKMMAAATRQVEPGNTVTFVNLPYFFGSRGPGTTCPRPYAFMPTGTVVIPPYADARDFALYNDGADLPVQAVVFSEYAPGWATHGTAVDTTGLREELKTSHVFVFDLLKWQLLDLSAVWQPDLPMPPSPGVADLQTIRLQQFELSQLETGIAITLTWQAIAPPMQDYTVFTQWLDDAGKLIAQHDSPPANGLAPTRLWQAGDQVVDAHFIPATAQWPRNSGSIVVGMYNPITATRLEAFDANKTRLPNDAVALWP